MTYTKEMILTELTNKGYDANLQVITKNGVEFNAIVIKNAKNTISPTLYFDELLEDCNNGKISFTDVIEHLVSIYEAHKDDEFSVMKFTDKDFILSNVYIGLQRESKEDLIKRDSGFEDIEAYLYLRIKSDDTSEAVVKLNPAIINLARVELGMLWSKAEENTFAETTITPIMSAISNLLGEDCPVEISSEVSGGIYVVSNKGMTCGAAAVLDKKALKKFAKLIKADKFIMIPSSRHEVLLVPDNGEMDMDDIKDMITSVNENEVAEVDQLGDKPYQIAV